jgi:hypothetical protein
VSNDFEADMDALAAGFLAGCKSLNVREIRHYYMLLQQRLSLAPAEFPENLERTREKMRGLPHPQVLGLFEAGISFLLGQTSLTNKQLSEEK